MSLWGRAFQGRLPDGSYAKSQEEYHAAWDEMISFLETAFPGYKIRAYDPGFSLSHPDSVWSLQLTGHAVEALMKAVDVRKPADAKPRRKGKHT